MDFNIEKLSHIFAFSLLLVSVFIIIIAPIVTFIMFYGTDFIEDIEISEAAAIFSQIIVIIVFIIVPFAWYSIVNNLGIKEFLKRIKLVSENLDMAFLWGIIATIIIFGVIFVLQLLLMYMGYTDKDLSNIPDLQALFSPIILFMIVGIQPIGEEIFFRGFLYEKFDKFGGPIIAIIFTSFLFGIAHMSYGKWFPVLMPMLMGLILGYIVYKTKNLYSAIIAHMVFNITSLSLAYLGQELLKDVSLIL